MKILIAGWFSFEDCNVTAGDVMAKDVACEWLERRNYEYDVALATPFVGGVNWRQVNPSNYSCVVFVCGPFPYINISIEFLQYFNSCRLIGLDLSMFESLNVWNPFDVLLERDSPTCSRPDISIISSQKKVPLVGIILVEPQHEYKNKDKNQIVNAAVDRLIGSREMVAIPIDTKLDPNTTNLRNAAEVESLIARMDLVVTTRLHGTVLSIKNGVPPIVIDGISGGAKVSRQAKTLGWDVLFEADNLCDEKLQIAFDYCLTEEAKLKATFCRNKAIKIVEQVGKEFINALEVSNLSSARVWQHEVIDKSLLNPPKTLPQLVLDTARTIKKTAINSIQNYR
ncbi:MAG: polysaccharide pyruvyl transferase family protein [Scytonematopsis contorta HA4267-MV1]|jgi:hypothetical protein|nr:polysaccharide pyruvyl transferase family protein [Scytonematopsis contorta HA4267-MV1]